MLNNIGYNTMFLCNLCKDYNECFNTNYKLTDFPELVSQRNIPVWAEVWFDSASNYNSIIEVRKLVLNQAIKMCHE